MMHGWIANHNVKSRKSLSLTSNCFQRNMQLLFNHNKNFNDIFGISTHSVEFQKI